MCTIIDDGKLMLELYPIVYLSYKSFIVTSTSRSQIPLICSSTYSNTFIKVCIHFFSSDHSLILILQDPIIQNSISSLMVLNKTMSTRSPTIGMAVIYRHLKRPGISLAFISPKKILLSLHFLSIFPPLLTIIISIRAFPITTSSHSLCLNITSIVHPAPFLLTTALSVLSPP